MHETKTIEEHAKEHKTAEWLFKATKVGELWAQGAEITEDEYLEAVEKTANYKYR